MILYLFARITFARGSRREYLWPMSSENDLAQTALSARGFLPFRQRSPTSKLTHCISVHRQLEVDSPLHFHEYLLQVEWDRGLWRLDNVPRFKLNKLAAASGNQMNAGTTLFGEVPGWAQHLKGSFCYWIWKLSNKAWNQNVSCTLYHHIRSTGSLRVK